MTSKSQPGTTPIRRRRRAIQGIVRIEVRASKQDARLMRKLAEALRGGDEEAAVIRSALRKALMDPEVTTAFDVFGSELPDEIFAGVLDQPRERGRRTADH